MRELKFRAWDKNEKIMVSPDNSDYDAYYNFEGWNVSNVVAINELLKSAPFTYMQFTGLKDKNGKEIYEGDIITLASTINNCIIEFSHGSFIRRFLDKRRNGEIKDYIPKNINYWEVIGNIYENPEFAILGR